MSNVQQRPRFGISSSYPAPLGGLSEFIEAIRAEGQLFKAEEELPDGFAVIGSRIMAWPFAGPDDVEASRFELIIVDEAHRVNGSHRSLVPRTTLMAAISDQGPDHRSAALAASLDFCGHEPRMAIAFGEGRVPREEQK